MAARASKFAQPDELCEHNEAVRRYTNKNNKAKHAEIGCTRILSLPADVSESSSFLLQSSDIPLRTERPT